MPENAPVPRFKISDQVRFHPMESGEMLAYTATKPVAIPLSFMPVISLFSNASPIAQAHAKLAGTEQEVSIEELNTFVGDLVEQGVLAPAVDLAPPPSLFDMLNPKHRNKETWDTISKGLKQGHCVIIRDALQKEFATSVHRSLLGINDWNTAESGETEQFAFHHHNIADPLQLPKEVQEVDRIFKNSQTKDFITQHCGRDCSGEATLSPSVFLPGDYQLPHDDANGLRNIAFVWHLSADWNPSWGGALYWVPTATYVPASFNTLILFNTTGGQSTHFVTVVTPRSRGRRLCINGWWNAPSKDAHCGLPTAAPTPGICVIEGDDSVRDGKALHIAARASAASGSAKNGAD